MDLNKLFSRFRKKLMGESLLKALLAATAFAAAAVFITSLIYHISIEETPLLLTALVGGSVFLVSFTVFFLLRYPTKKRIAARLDALGLKERATTMLAYQHVDTEIARLQRQDAISHIEKTSPKDMKLQLRPRESILSIACLCLAVVMLLLPFNIFAAPAPEQTEDEARQQIVRELIRQLRDEVQEAELDEQLKEQLEQIINELEQDSQEAESDLQEAGEIQQSIEQLQEFLEESLTKNDIGEALQKYPLTRQLGEAISDGDGEKVTVAMNTLETQVLENTALLTELSSTVLSALTDSGVAEDDSLYSALAQFANTLTLMGTAQEDFATHLHKLFEDTTAAILAALEQQANLEQQLSELLESLEEAKDQLLGNQEETQPEGTEGENQESQNGEGNEGENQEGERPEGEMPEGQRPEGEMPQGQMPEGMGGENPGEGEGSLNTMTEGIYDPVSGSVTYGEVFAAYYAEYLEALENGTVSEELQEIMDQYFSALG
ncbi:MAG: hypothetical protein IKU07_00945 [Oscillospiraceae bacterium]|nr:hypothetical protein [Oscillospiraceae bacterium]